MDEYCANYVDMMGVDAEGVFVDTGLLFIALGCFGMTIFLDRRADVQVNVLETNPAKFEGNDPTVPTRLTGSVHL